MRSSAGASSSLPGTYARAVRGSSAATRSQCAATNDTELPAAGTKRHLGALPEPAGSKARAGPSSDAVAALREAVADSDTPMSEAGACAQLAQSQVSEIVDPASEVLDSEKLEHEKSCPPHTRWASLMLSMRPTSCSARGMRSMQRPAQQTTPFRTLTHTILTRDNVCPHS